jgi:hypothetical protein
MVHHHQVVQAVQVLLHQLLELQQHTLAAVAAVDKMAHLVVQLLAVVVVELQPAVE